MTELSFGEWLKRQRMGRGLTREQLANQIGCAVVTLRKLESEERRPSAQIADQLIKIFEIPEQQRAHFFKFARGDWTKAPGNSSNEQPWQASKSTRTNLPAPLTSFIGRENEQSEVIDLLTKHRLVTLTGAGGIGKTRLSLHVGQKLRSAFSHGIWFVELASILDPALVPHTTAITIGLRDEPQRPVLDMLCDYLRDKKMLIILDNCEHLVSACMLMVDKILRSAADLRVLASSREALGVPGEVNYRVPSLNLPDMQPLPPVESLSRYEAVMLFIERAKSAVPNFAVTNENATALVQLCHRLDGIPLAIELAAAKTHVLSVEQIAKRLDDRFRLLTSGNRTALERHQTLHAAIDWSYNLLSPSEQILFRRLSVFVGGWTLEAVESVCVNETIRSEDILNLLEQLINKSLVIADEWQWESRYRMLETIRQYANEKLFEKGESDSLRDQHLEYFRNLAAQAEPELNSEQQVVWLSRLETELDNIRAALVWAHNGGSVTAGLHLAVRLRKFWTSSYHFREPALALENFLSKPLPADQLQLLAQAHFVKGWLEYLLENSVVALAHANESERLCLQLGLAGKADLAKVRNMLVSIQVFQEHNPIRGLEIVEENLKLLQEIDDHEGMQHAMNARAVALTQMGDLIGARKAFEECLMLAREWGDNISAANANEGLAGIALEEGKYEEARQRCESNLLFYRQASITLKFDEQLWILGATAIREEDYARAKAYYTECLLFDRQIGWPRNQLAECLIGFAGIANAEKRFERGAQLLGAAETDVEARGTVPMPLAKYDQKEFERLVETLCKELGDAAFEALSAKGRAMTMEKAIAFALEE